MKTLSKEHVEKLKKGRQKNITEKYGLVCRINDEIEIWADQYQYILKRAGIKEGHYPSLNLAVEDLLDMRLKERLIANNQKNIEGLLNALEEFQIWAGKLLKPLNTHDIATKIITRHNTESKKE